MQPAMIGHVLKRAPVQAARQHCGVMAVRRPQHAPAQMPVAREDGRARAWPPWQACLHQLSSIESPDQAEQDLSRAKKLLDETKSTMEDSGKEHEDSRKQLEESLAPPWT